MKNLTISAVPPPVPVLHTLSFDATLDELKQLRLILGRFSKISLRAHTGQVTLPNDIQCDLYFALDKAIGKLG